MKLLGWWRRPARPALRALGGAAAGKCAALHGQSFAHGWSRVEFERLIAADNILADGAFDRAGRLLGFVLSRHMRPEAEIMTVAVASAQRGAGLGRALLAFHIARLEAIGIADIFLEVETGNAPALALYKRYDFAEVGARPNYYRKADGARAGALVLKRSGRAG